MSAVCAAIQSGIPTVCSRVVRPLSSKDNVQIWQMRRLDHSVYQVITNNLKVKPSTEFPKLEDDAPLPYTGSGKLKQF